MMDGPFLSLKMICMERFWIAAFLAGLTQSQMRMMFDYSAPVDFPAGYCDPTSNWRWTMDLWLRLNLALLADLQVHGDPLR